MKLSFITLLLILKSSAFHVTSILETEVEGKRSLINIAHTKRAPAYVYTPANYSYAKKYPLVVLLHGTPCNADFQNLYFRLSYFVTRRQFILLTPEGTKDHTGARFWNATDSCCDEDHSGVDDETYLLSLIAQAEREYSIDPTRVYIFGHSNGAVMAYRLACHAGNIIAGIASLAGTTYQDQSQCAPKVPISVLEIHAVDDTEILYNGGTYMGAKYPGAVETVNRWVASNGCTGRVSVAPSMDNFYSIPGDDTTGQVWSQCKEGTDVALWTIEPFKFHFAHAPVVKREFVDRVLDFLFAHTRKG